MIAHRVGEPFGSLVLAVSVTVIEVALIVTLMVSGGSDTATLARDTVFAAVMITCNGIVGVCLLIGALRAGVASFNAEGTATALATVATLATLTLVLPTFTTSTPGPEFSAAQLAFAATASIALYALFVVVQTVRHRDYFLPVGDGPEEHAAPPSHQAAQGRICTSGKLRSRLFFDAFPGVRKYARSPCTAMLTGVSTQLPSRLRVCSRTTFSASSCCGFSRMCSVM